MCTRRPYTHSIGTTLEITAHTFEPDGKILVVNKGLERFRVTKVRRANMSQGFFFRAENPSRSVPSVAPSCGGTVGRALRPWTVRLTTAHWAWSRPSLVCRQVVKERPVLICEVEVIPADEDDSPEVEGGLTLDSALF